MTGMVVALAVLSGWFALTSVPSVATVEWRCGVRGEQVRVVPTPPVATTTVVFRGRRRVLNATPFATPWLRGTARLELIQATSARTLDATLAIRFSSAGFCEPYLPPPFTLRVVRR